MDLIAVLILLSIGQGIFLGFLLLTLKRGNKTANSLLGILMLLFSFSISGFLLQRTETYQYFSFLIGLPSTVLFLFGPMFLFYVKELTFKNFKFKSADLLHFIPFAALIIYKIPLFFQTTVVKLRYVELSTDSVSHLIILSLQTLHLFVYLYYVNGLLNDYEAEIKKTMSSIDKLNLRWIKFGINAFVMIFGLMAVFIVLFFAGFDLYDHFNNIIPVLVSVAILSIGYLGLSRPIIIAEEPENNRSKKYEKSSLTSEKSEKYLKMLMQVIEEKKPFLESDLTLQKLADMIALPPYHLSQIINEKMDQNFFDFINSYRVEEAKLLFADPRSELLTILAVAEEVGFNSKSSFNNAFKKCTSMTPTQYKELIRRKKNV